MKKLVPVCIVLAIFSVALVNHGQSHKIVDFDQDLHHMCLYPTIRISSVEGHTGSGVIVRSDKIGDSYHNVALTCMHCINDFDEYQVEMPVYNRSAFERYDIFRLVFYAGSPDHDLAVVMFITPYSVHVAKMDFNQQLNIGNKVSHIGCGTSDEPRLDDGRITSIGVQVGKYKNHAYRTSMHTVFGDSGGPAFYNNKLIGLMQAIKTTHFRGFPAMLNNISYCIPIGTVKTWDGEEENNRLRFIYTPELPLPVWPYTELGYDFDWDKSTGDHWR